MLDVLLSLRQETSHLIIGSPLRVANLISHAFKSDSDQRLTGNPLTAIQLQMWKQSEEGTGYTPRLAAE